MRTNMRVTCVTVIYNEANKLCDEYLEDATITVLKTQMQVSKETLGITAHHSRSSGSHGRST
jgi:hypothetical protein